MPPVERSWDESGADVPRWVVPTAALVLLALLLLVALALVESPTPPAGPDPRPVPSTYRQPAPTGGAR